MRSNEDVAAIYRRHWRTVWNVCRSYLPCVPDVEDAVQDVFLRLARTERDFESPDHERAWLVVVARNMCRNELKRARRRDRPFSDAAAAEAPAGDGENEVLAAIRALPEPYRTPVYLYYYEGWSTAKIARLTGRTESGIRTRLKRARALLRRALDETL